MLRVDQNERNLKFYSQVSKRALLTPRLGASNSPPFKWKGIRAHQMAIRGLGSENGISLLWPL